MVIEGKKTPDGKSVAAQVVMVRRDGAVPIIDMGGGYGGSTKETLEDNNISCVGYKGSLDSSATSVVGKMAFKNKRTEAYWRFREALDTYAKDGLSYLNSLPKEAFPKTDGQLYEVNIPDDDELLLWDKTIDKQPDKIKKILKESGLWKELKGNLSDFSSPQNTRGKLRGENIYAFLSWKLGSEKSASLRLNELGIPGMKYPAGTIANVKGSGYNYVIFDDSAVEVLRTFYQGDGNGPRGSVQFLNDKTLINLFEGADLSTALHEAGHIWLEMVRRVYGHSEATDQMRTDLNVLYAWWEQNAGSLWRDIKASNPFAVRKISDDLYAVTGMSGERGRFKTEAEAKAEAARLHADIVKDNPQEYDYEQQH